MKDILKNFTLFIGTLGYAGMIEEIQLPKLTLKTEELRNGGMDAPIEIEQGMEKIECALTFSGLSVEVMKLLGKPNSELIARGNLYSHGGAQTAVEILMTGMVKETDPGSWKSGEKAPLKATVTCHYYKYTQGGHVIHEIDIPNMKRVIDGEDQLATARQNLGM